MYKIHNTLFDSFFTYLKTLAPSSLWFEGITKLLEMEKKLENVE